MCVTLTRKNLFSNEDKVIIQNDCKEKDCSASKIWKNYSSEKLNYSAVKRLLKKLRKIGLMDKRQGSGKPRTLSTEGNVNLIHELVCSQEVLPHTHLAPTKIAEQRGISWLSIRKMVKKRNIKQFKR